jgi:LPXTG-motif cell wall-anchored protein
VHFWRRFALGGIAALTSSLVVTIPAGAAESHPGGVTDTCPEVLAGAPTGGIEKVTDPADGSEVRRGDVLFVTLHWDTTTFTGPVLHKALDCVTVDGAPADELSTQERDTATDGRFETRSTVPGDLTDGTRLCDRGFVSGPAGDGFGREKSNDVCFIVRGDRPAEGPAPAVTPVPTETVPSPDTPGTSDSPGTPDAPSGAPEAELTAPEVTPGPAPAKLTATPLASPVTATTPTPAPILAGPAGQGPPGTQVAPETVVADQPPATLPQTGSATEKTVRLGILALLLGGISLVAGRRRAVNCS